MAEVRQLISFVHVEDVQRSVDFYEQLGLEVTDTYENEGWLLWVAMQRGDARIMFALASDPVQAHAQAVLFYLYADDLDALHASLRAGGVDVGEIVDGRPGPDREFRLEDPDGYVLLVAEHNPEW